MSKIYFIVIIMFLMSIIEKLEKNEIASFIILILAVIRPFRDNYKITITKKATGPDYEYRFISIVLKNKNDDYYKLPDELVFPNFEAKTMYKNMDIGKNYTLEELGL